jgi:hypothetical protein
MEWLSQLARRLLMLLRRGRLDSDLEDEMCLHRELRKQENINAGMTPEEAALSLSGASAMHCS